MHGAWEHVDRRDGAKPEAGGRKLCRIAREALRIAGNVGETPGARCLQEFPERFRGAAGEALVCRVGDDEGRSKGFYVLAFERLLNGEREKLGVPEVISAGIRAGALNRVGNALNAECFSGPPCGEKRQGADAAVEVEHPVVFGNSESVERKAVEHRRLRGIHLQKGFGAD